MDINAVYPGDARVLGQEVTTESMDVVFTDPPYLREYIPLYGWVGEWAKRVLKPNGWLFVYAGGYWKDQVMALLGEHLQYFWDFTMLMQNASVMWPRHVIAKSKSLLVYHRKQDSPLPRTMALGVWGYGRMDKTLHGWGQDEETARYYLDCFCYPGQLVCDPFCGAGTTLIVAKMLGLNYLGFDIDLEAVATTQQRLDGFTQTRAQPFLIDATQLALTEGG